MSVNTFLSHRRPVATPSGEALAGQPDQDISRPNTAPAYYQGRPASLWINAMKPRRRGAALTRLKILQ
jgi:hypothetical protein